LSAFASDPLTRSGVRKHPSGGWWGLRPRIGRGKGERVLMPDERRGRRNADRGPFGGVGPLVVRLVLAAILIARAYDKVFDTERLGEFADRLDTGPLPTLTVAAVLVYAQLVVGAGLALGLLTRPLALIAIMHAVAALLLTESGGAFAMWVVPIATLAGGAFLARYGAGRLALDELRDARAP
jgi:uncharacterized membrane protein YphA (DoxX/SURF4 family)